MDKAVLRRKILKQFQLHGFAIKAEGVSWLADQLSDTTELDLWIGQLINKLQAHNIDGIAVDAGHLKKCLTECTSKKSTTDTIFSVINASEVPLFRFDAEKNKFFKDDAMEKERQLLPAAHMKSYIYRRRYAIILQRMKRTKLFEKQSLGRREGPVVELSIASKFLCTTAKISGAFMLGLLVIRGTGIFELEDPTGSVKLDLSQCSYNPGLFVEHCFVLAEGTYDDGVFYANKMAMPIAEKAEESALFFNNQNSFGGPSETSLRSSEILWRAQTTDANATIVFLSDVWLDNVKILDKLKKLFEGLAEAPPVAFILMGNFLQQQTGADYTPRLKAALSNLADMIFAVPPVCKQSNFVLISGPNDPGSPAIYPRAGLPECLTANLRQKVKHLTLASNPCRIQYCQREIVCMRADLVSKMCRNVINYPSDKQIPQHFARTILGNGTLAPMSLYTLPTYWGFNNAMDLYPLPNLVVVADKQDAFSTRLNDCHVINPGSLSRGGFKIYLPAPDEVETSEIPDDD